MTNTQRINIVNTANPERLVNDRNLRKALDLIREHITEAPTVQNSDLSAAVNLIVGAVRHYGLLDPAESTWIYRENVLGFMYACDGCAEIIEKDVVTDDDGTLTLTGNSRPFFGVCALCGDSSANHEVEVK